MTKLSLARFPSLANGGEDNHQPILAILSIGVEVRSPARPTVQHLRILLRHDGDIQVEYHDANKSGSPFELLFILEAGHEEEAIKQVSLFVADVLSERLVLVYSKGVFRGGRRFLIPALTEANRRHLKWSTSWLGTYDWQP